MENDKKLTNAYLEDTLCQLIKNDLRNIPKEKMKRETILANVKKYMGGPAFAELRKILQF